MYCKIPDILTMDEYFRILFICTSKFLTFLEGEGHCTSRILEYDRT